MLRVGQASTAAVALPEHRLVFESETLAFLLVLPDTVLDIPRPAIASTRRTHRVTDMDLAQFGQADATTIISRSWFERVTATISSLVTIGKFTWTFAKSPKKLRSDQWLHNKLCSLFYLPTISRSYAMDFSSAETTMSSASKPLGM